MLRKIRVTFAAVFFILITLLFLDFTGTIHIWFGWMAKIQFLPALLALNAGVVIFLLLLTLLFGRVYCSVICPLGVFQDLVSWISGSRKKKKYRFSFSPAKTWLRWSVFVLFIIAFVAGFSAFIALLAPYSSYGRIASNLFAPVYQLGNNLLAYLSERANSYLFYSTEVWIKSLSTFIVAVITFLVLTFLAWKNGRTYCNTICPVGTILGFLSKYALFRPVIDTEKCNNCGLCTHKCKAACINSQEHKIDYSRCVVCMDCIETCKHGAIHYKFQSPLKKNAETIKGNGTENNPAARRSFLSLSTLLATSAVLKAQEKKVDGGFADIIDKKAPERLTPITPPGSLSAKNFTAHCTACQLCVSVCPNQVLHPTSRLNTFMQPEMSYERGYCRPECVKCSEVCPTGAIKPITKADKSAIQIGHAVYIADRCVVNRDNEQCTNCFRHCPTGAIQLVAKEPNNPKSLKIPAINVEKCIGCGACENLCPSRPLSAIYVEGHEVHRTI